MIPLFLPTHGKILDVYQPECDSLDITSSGKAGQKYPKAMGTYKLIPKYGINESPVFKHTYNDYYLLYYGVIDSYYGIRQWVVSCNILYFFPIK